MNIVQFWVGYSCLLAIITTCAFINASLYKRVNKLVQWLTTTVKPTLLRHGELTEVRQLSNLQIPVLEQWTDDAIWYSLITLVLQILLVLVGLLVVNTHQFSYILLTVIVCLLGSMVMFFPRTVTRRRDVIKVSDFYQLAHTTILEKQKEMSNASNTDSNGTSTPS